MSEDKKQTIMRLTGDERRAMQMPAGALGLSATGWTSEMIREKWNEKFPGFEFPDEKGEIKPKKGK